MKRHAEQSRDTSSASNFELDFFMFCLREKRVHFIMHAEDLRMPKKIDLVSIRQRRDQLIAYLNKQGFNVQLLGLHQLKIAQLKEGECVLLDISLTPKNVRTKYLQSLNLNRENLFEKCFDYCTVIIFDPEAEIPKYAHDFFTWLPIGGNLYQMFT